MERVTIKTKSGFSVQIGNFNITEIVVTAQYFETMPEEQALGGALRQSVEHWKLFNFVAHEWHIGYAKMGNCGEPAWEVLDGCGMLGILRYSKLAKRYLYWKFREPLFLLLPKLPILKHCGKMSFATLDLALNTLHDMPNRELRQKQPVRAYHCPDCGLFHLTSLPSNFDNGTHPDSAGTLSS